MKLLDRMRAVVPATPSSAPGAPRFTLADRLGRTDVAVPDRLRYADPERNTRLGRKAVTPSQELTRIARLPRRTVSQEQKEAYAREMTARLRRAVERCSCATRWGRCIDALNAIQGWALCEHGKLCPIGVGHGKTGICLLLPMVVPECKRAVLLVPSNAKAQLLDVDYPQWSVHFTLPNLAGGEAFTAGRPVLHVLSYSELSSQTKRQRLEEIAPDLIIADETHLLRRKGTGRTARFLRYLERNPATRFVALSGTLTSSSIRDYAHLADLALGERSPLPRIDHIVDEWADAIDVQPSGGFRAPIGALRALCEPGETARSGFGRRLVDTPGVVATEDAALLTPLRIAERPLEMPKAVADAVDQILASGERPDGHRFPEQIQVVECARQMACGFFYQRYWPHGEPEHVIVEWLAALKEWNAEVYQELKRPAEHLDTPGLLENAAKRALGLMPNPNGLPEWNSATYLRWHRIRDQAHPEQRTIWLSDFMVLDAAAWARAQPGIVWTSFSVLGPEIAKAAGIPYYGGGDEASATIIHERADRSIVASANAHKASKNLQRFHRNLVTTIQPDALWWEQLLGRTHRFGSTASVVEADVYRHTEDAERAFETALERARYQKETRQGDRKLLRAEITFPCSTNAPATRGLIERMAPAPAPASGKLTVNK